jgi:5'-deoxynucleotidase
MNPDLYLSGFVQRYHTHPTLARLGQTLAHHQWGVATLLAKLHPEPSAALLKAALWHDVGEFVSGDVPYTAKRNNVALSYESKRVEDRAREEITGHMFIEVGDSSLWLELADRLEAYLYVNTVAPDLLDSDEWFECSEDIFDLAHELGVYHEVAELMG